MQSELLFPESIVSTFTASLKQAADALASNVFDSASWMVIMRHYNSIPTPINDDSRLVFNTFLKYFPTAADYVFLFASCSSFGLIFVF
jgi:hypothetical protein